MQRNNKGQFAPGNTIASAGGRARAQKLSRRRRRNIAKMGWQALVEKRFAGDERTARTWWGAMGAWHSDATYRQAGLGHMPWPGTISEFCNRFWQLALFNREELDHQARLAVQRFTLDDVEPLEF